MTPQSRFRTKSSDNIWDYKPPEVILVYDPDTVDLNDAERSQAEAILRRKETTLDTFNGACDGAKELIVYAVSSNAVIALKR